MVELFRSFFWLIFPIGGMAIGVFAIYMVHDTKRRTIELLRIYAEQGKEPPQSLLDALDRTNSFDGESPARVKDDFRSAYGPFSTNPVALWSRFVLLAFLAAGFGGMAYWLNGKPGTEFIVFGFTITAFVLAAVSASALVRALLTRADGKS